MGHKRPTSKAPHRHGRKAVMTPPFDAEELVNSQHGEGHESLGENDVCDGRRQYEDHQYHRREPEVTPLYYHPEAADSFHQRREGNTERKTPVYPETTELEWDDRTKSWRVPDPFPASSSSYSHAYDFYRDEREYLGTVAYPSVLEYTTAEGDENDLSDFEQYFEQDSGYYEALDGESKNGSMLDRNYESLAGGAQIRHMGHGSSVTELNGRNSADGSCAKVWFPSKNTIPKWTLVKHIMDTGNKTGLHMVSQGILKELEYRLYHWDFAMLFLIKNYSPSTRRCPPCF